MSGCSSMAEAVSRILVEPDITPDTHHLCISPASCGQYATQLLRASGYKVVTTASPRNFALVQSLGADAVFDYRDPEVVTKIKAATGNSIKSALDTISEKESLRITADSIGSQGGKVVVLLPPSPEATSRKDVEFKRECLHPFQASPT